MTCSINDDEISFKERNLLTYGIDSLSKNWVLLCLHKVTFKENHINKWPLSYNAFTSPFNQLMSQASAAEVSGQRFKWNGQETLSQDDPEMWNLLQQEKERQVFSLKDLYT